MISKISSLDLIITSNNSDTTGENRNSMRERNVIFSKLGNFRVTFISLIFCFQIICEILNLRTSIHVVFMADTDSLLARTLNSRRIEFVNICKN